MSKQHGKFRRGSVSPDQAGLRVEEDAAFRIREAASREWRPGHEQYTLFTWAAVVPDRMTSTVEHRSLRRHIQHLVLLSVGYTGMPTQRDGNGREFVSVIAPVEISNDWKMATGAPIARSFGSADGSNRPQFDQHREHGWFEAATFLAEQMLTLFQVTPSGRLEEHALITGPAAVRVPKLLLNIEKGLNADGVPKTPKFVAIDDITDSSVLNGELTPDDAAFECETSLTPGYDVRKWTEGRRPAIPLYGTMPWFVLRTNIRSAHAVLDGILANWYLW